MGPHVHEWCCRVMSCQLLLNYRLSCTVITVHGVSQLYWSALSTAANSELYLYVVLFEWQVEKNLSMKYNIHDQLHRSNIFDVESINSSVKTANYFTLTLKMRIITVLFSFLCSLYHQYSPVVVLYISIGPAIILLLVMAPCALLIFMYQSPHTPKYCSCVCGYSPDKVNTSAVLSTSCATSRLTTFPAKVFESQSNSVVPGCSVLPPETEATQSQAVSQAPAVHR